MKKTTIIFVAAMLLTTIIHAQVNLGLHADFLLSNAQVKADNGNGGTEDAPGLKSLPGFKFGVVAQVPMGETFAFMPELNFVHKGIKQSVSVSQTAGGITISSQTDNQTSFNYLEIPLNVAYKATSSAGSFFGGLGPVFSLGLSGKSKSHHVSNFAGLMQDTTVDMSIKFDGKKEADVTDNDSHAKALEMGANVFAGFQLTNGLFFKAQYFMAFSNIVPDQPGSYKSNYLGIGVGFMFGQGKSKTSK